MAQGQHFFILTTITLVLLLIISKCHSYPRFGELPGMNRSIRISSLIDSLLFFDSVVVGGRPMKVYSPHETDRYANRVRFNNKFSLIVHPFIVI